MSMSAIYVEILATKGSTPREAGTSMKVTAVNSVGTIGGGALEHQAIETARKMIAQDVPDLRRTIPLGPGLGQCCGGSVTLRFTRTPRPMEPEPRRQTPLHVAPGVARKPLWVWGAGHVGRATLRQAVPTGGFDIVWVDSALSRFPEPMLPGVTPLPASDMPRVMPYAPRDGMHLIMTYSHDIDLALCAAALRHGFAFCGLIGSDTKWARFRKRLQDMGLDPSAITCPIGDPSLGKHPDQIAAGTVRALLAPDVAEVPEHKEQA